MGNRAPIGQPAGSCAEHFHRTRQQLWYPQSSVRENVILQDCNKAESKFLALWFNLTQKLITREHKETFWAAPNGLSLQDLTVVDDDYTFATKDGDHYIPYGWTTGCHSAMEIRMDLTGTRFSFASQVPNRFRQLSTFQFASIQSMSTE